MATITGQRASSPLPARDTPRIEDRRSGTPEAISRAAAAVAAWGSVVPALAGTPHVRISRDGGRTYPARHARPLPAEPPGQPCTIPVFHPASGTGRMLVLDLDVSRAGRAADGPAVHDDRQRGAVEVATQALAIAELVARCGGQVLADVAPTGGRHIYVVFAAALPWRELRDLCRAMALRFPSIDTAPMASLGGQISPPGSRHKSGGWRLLSTPVDIALAAMEHPNGPEVWNGLLDGVRGRAAADRNRFHGRNTVPRAG